MSTPFNPKSDLEGSTITLVNSLGFNNLAIRDGKSRPKSESRSWTQNDDFLFRLARTWRGLPKDSSGLSYGKQGVNKANVTYKTASSTLDQIQRA